MKNRSKLFVVALVFGLVGGAEAACSGPYCYDDAGAYVEKQSLHVTTLKAGLETATTTQMATKTPLYSFQLLGCSSGCPNAGTVCISTGTGTGAWIVFGSTETVNGRACDGGL